MVIWLPTLIAVGCAIFAYRIWRRWQAAARAAFVRRYTLPKGIFDKLRARHPGLTTKDCQLVAHALRQFFLAYIQGGFRPVAMPSQVADDLWHEFILHTRSYEQFCARAFGRFLHHTPAAQLGSVTAQDEGLRRCWRLACQEDGIHPQRPTRVPLLFAIDGKLAIPGGFLYAPDCNRLGRVGKDGRPVHCGSDLAGGSTDGDSGDSSSADDGDSGCSGGGCGGD